LSEGHTLSPNISMLGLSGVNTVSSKTIRKREMGKCKREEETNKSHGWVGLRWM